MKKHYVPVTQRIWPVLFWAVLLMSNTAGGQSVPDAQWARVGRTLAITADGTIATTEGISEPTFSGLSKSGEQVVKYNLQGDKVWQTGFLQGGDYIGGQIQGYNYEVLGGLRIAGTTDGGVAVVGGSSLGGAGSIATKINANGSQQGWGNSDRSPYGDLTATPDGGFLILASANKAVSVSKHNAAHVRIWTKQIVYAAPGSTTPDQSLIRGKTVITTPDGGFLVAGYFNGSGIDSPERGWVVKLDGEGNVVWQKLLTDFPYDINPGSLISMSTITDAMVSADGAGYALVGLGVTLPNISGTGVVELNFNGNIKPGRAKLIDTQVTFSYITTYTGRDSKKYYAIGYSWLQGRIDPKIQLFDPVLFNGVAARIFQGPGQSSLTGIGTAGDGSLVFVTDNNQLVKLVPEPVSPPAGALTLTPPTYNCQTGVIVFNTTGGDGSPITYSAPGISRSSATSNTGTVEQGLRNDPKPILITATQNGQSASYTFDLKAACSGTPVPQPPVYNPIPDQFYTVGQSVYFSVGSYFSDFTTGIPGYSPNWSVSVTGLPDGLSIFSRNDVGSPNPTVVILGTPRTTGVYTVSVTANNGASVAGNPVQTTFQITVSADTPPKGGALALTQPPYNCQTGAIVFNTTGGDGSPITYSAPGISRSSATSNTGTVEPGLRNDPKPLTITAYQNGNTVSYTFDFGAYCANPQPPTPPTPPPGSPFTLLAPTYDCGSGAIRFNTSGGNGSSIEYMAPGITGWTSNPNQFVDKDSRTANDVKPFTLMARQSGVVVSYVWDLKAACGRARVGAGERESALSVSVLGNPVEGKSAVVEIRGVADQAVQVDLTDLQGRVLHQQRINQAGSTERVSVPVGNGNGMLLLNVSTATQRRQMKLLKP